MKCITFVRSFDAKLEHFLWIENPEKMLTCTKTFMGASCSCTNNRLVAEVPVQNQQQIPVETQKPHSPSVCFSPPSEQDEESRPRASSKSAEVLGQWKTGAVNSVAAKVEHFVSE